MVSSGLVNIVMILGILLKVPMVIVVIVVIVAIVEVGAGISVSLYRYAVHHAISIYVFP